MDRRQTDLLKRVYDQNNNFIFKTHNISLKLNVNFHDLRSDTLLTSSTDFRTLNK